jgi:hypothetical protein
MIGKHPANSHSNKSSDREGQMEDLLHQATIMLAILIRNQGNTHGSLSTFDGKRALSKARRCLLNFSLPLASRGHSVNGFLKPILL